MNFIPITDAQKKFLSKMWHWEFWWWTEDTKELQKLINEGKISKYDASDLIHHSKEYLDQETWVKDHKYDGTINLDKAENHLNGLKQIICQRAQDLTRKYKIMS